MRPTRMVAGLMLAGWALTLAAPQAALASGPTVVGAGSTWVQIALDQWRADIARQGLTINYQGVGSTTGRQWYIINQIDFAASEIPFQPDEVAELHKRGKSYQYLPDVAGGTSLMYNLHDSSNNRIRNLQLSAVTAAKIFTGQITNWADPAITADNGGRAMPAGQITPVIRSDGSGTSAQFSLYLANQAPSVWNQFVNQYHCPAPCQFWPTFPHAVSAKGSDGVANYVANDSVGRGSIGYLEYGYATQRNFPVAMMRNYSGHYVVAAPNNVATALTHATLNPDLTQNLTGVYRAPEANAYPMSSYSYMITQTTGFDPAKGAVLGRWIIYIACGGQQEAAVLGYSPLPANLVLADFAAVRRIPGAPTPPPLSQCNNPNISHGGGGGPSPGGGGGGGGSGGSGSPTGNGSGSGPRAKSPSSAPSTNPNFTGGFVPMASPTGPGAILTEADRRARRNEAFRAVRYAEPQNLVPLVLGALGLMVLVFGPLFFQRRGRSGR